MAAGIDEDTAQTLQNGRETLGSLLRSAQKNGQKVFIVWVVGLLATISVLQGGLWDTLWTDLVENKLPAGLTTAADKVAVTPFDVILLQVKIGAVVGIVIAMPLVIYYSRHALRERGYWPGDEVPRWKLVGLTLIGFSLFAAGVVYAYELFFPLMFKFLVSNADSAGFLPKYSIVKWTQFVVLLGTSFGMAAQLPLFMTGLSYTGVVPYETFRDRWKWAVVAIFVFGALFSPPDPFTQIMWATPLVGLYAISLGISKIVVQAKRAGEEVGIRSTVRQRWNKLLAAAVVVGGIAYVIVATEVFQYVKTIVATVSTSRARADVVRPEFFGTSPEASAIALAALFGAIGFLVALYYYMVQELDVAAAEAGHFGDPAKIDVGALTADAVGSAPPEAFEEMEEEEALRLADEAMGEDDPEKAQAILDRFDQAQELAGDEAAEGDAEEAEHHVVTQTTAGMVDAFTEDDTTEDDIGGLYYDLAFILDSLTSKAIWIVGTFMIVAGITFVFLYSGVPGTADAAITGNGTVIAENGTTVARGATVVATNVTLRYQNGTGVAERGVLVAENGSSAVRPATAVVPNGTAPYPGASVYEANATAGGHAREVATNSTVLILSQPPRGSTSGIGLVKNAFVSHLPPRLQEQVDFVTLHPVEHLIFIVKFSTILGAVATIPVLLFLAWPAMRKRGLARGDRNVLGVWGGTVFGTLIVGTIFGFLYVAPLILSWLAQDMINSGILIRYRVANFGWLVLMFTVGIGLLIEIPVTMLLFHKGGIVTFQQIVRRWRPVTLGVFVAAALLSPESWFTMFMVAIPITLMFLVGLGALWLYTLGGRREPGGAGEPAD